MTAILQVGNQTFSAEEVVIRLSNSKIFNKFLQEIVIDEAIKPFTCTPEEEKILSEKFYAGCTDEENQAWLEQNGLTREEVAKNLKRKAEIEKFKEANWGKVVESYFFEQRKHQLDRIIYSIIYHQDYDVITELYFRLVDEKQSFADLASEYSQGAEAKIKGIVGPIELSQLPDNISRLLTSHPPKTILAPKIGKYHTLLQLELFIPAKFDESMRQRMMEELFQQWLKKKVAEQSN